MAHITGVKITNFINIGKTATFKEFDQQNVLAGLFVGFKKSVAKAIFFGLGASMEQLSLTHYDDLKMAAGLTTVVELTLKHNEKDYIFQRKLLNQNKQEFVYNSMSVDEDVYHAELKMIDFDMSKQMLFCDSSNVLCSMLATRPLDLMSTITGLKMQTNSAVKHFRGINESKKTLDRLKKYDSWLINGIKKLNDALPEFQESHPAEFSAFTISNLKREEKERVARKAELVALQAESDALNGVIQSLRATIERESELRNQKTGENWDMFQQIEQPEDVSELLQNCKLVLGTRKMILERSLAQVQERLKTTERLLTELERLKNESERNITFMKDASGTHRKSRMIPRDNLLKLYPIFHGSEELDMDKLELKLIVKKGELTKMKNEHEIFHFFEQVLPQRKIKEMAEPENIEEILAECNAAVKDIFHPKAYMPSNEKLKLTKLSSLIPSSKGFLLHGTFRAIDEQHQAFIENILEDYSSVIVLFKDTAASIYDILKKEYAEWYPNVTFLVLSELPEPRSRVGYVAPQDHWLNYCTFTHTHIDDKNRRKLMFYLGKQLEIYRVESVYEVKEAFRHATKKYVASVDGRFIYTRHSFGFDIIKYIRPGKTPEGMEFGESCQRLEDSIRKLSELTLTFMETENVPRQPPVSNTAALEAEVDKLEQEFAEKLRRKNDQLEALHRHINEPYEAPDVQNYADALVEEQHRLDSINGRITEAQGEIARHRTEITSLLAKIDGLRKDIDLKGKIAVNEQDIGKHNKTIKESEQQMTKLNMSVARLQLKITNLLQEVASLKYKTIKTVLQAHQANIDWTTVDCITEPRTLWQDIQNGIYIDPLVMQINFSDMDDIFDRDVFYASSGWYAVRDICQQRATEMNVTYSAAKAKLQNCEQRFNRLRAIIINQCNHFSILINTILNDIGREIHPNDNIVYEINFDFDAMLNNNSATFKIKIDGDVIGFKALSKADRLRTSWLLFAALNEYSKAPFAFIDLEQMDDEGAKLIYPIIRRMSEKCQLFIDVSSTRDSTLANVHYGLNPNDGYSDDGQRLTKVIRHDSTKYVYVDVEGNVDQRDGTVDQRDGTVDQRDGTVDQRDETVDQRDGTVDQRDGSVDQRDGSVDQRDGSVDQRDGYVDQRDGTVDQRDGTSTNSD
ncbi:uncharacterized protein LOC119085541 [Bradysia coprophila]|uniref:uncharacterized protein LOC119085541 n=1 Tax=Bradysia coprophila TaxID=38358 RepID=UPI00187DA5C8|nr:uncharacterized protein LOC119085541 [Bradysia coprophila]